MRPFHAFDVETSIIDFEASAWRKGTFTVLSGLLTDATFISIETRCKVFPEIRSASAGGIIAGHNLAFDIGHLIKEHGDEALKWLLAPKTQLWDTQIIDYILRGCAVVMPSLENSCAHYGIEFKKDTWSTDAFKRGIGADVLYKENPARLTEYLADDLRATRALANAQRALLTGKYRRLQNTIAVQMRVLKLVALCHYFGLRIDKKRLRKLINDNRAKYTTTETQLAAHMDVLINSPIARAQFNPDSPTQINALLYGGAFEYQTRREVGKFKTGKKIGQPRYKIDRHNIKFQRLSSEDAGTAAHVLTRIKGTTNNKPLRDFLTCLLTLRAVNKHYSTYYLPMDTRPVISESGRLHGTFNMCVTNTGRKSSSNINLQNIPEEARTAIIAAANCQIAAPDFKQLELIAAAYLSGDQKLIRAVQKGIDIHGKISAKVEQLTGHPVKRTDVKRVVFGRIYGGGAATLSNQSGIPLEVVRTIIELLDRAFPVLAKFWLRVRAKLEQNRGRLNGDSNTSHYMLPTGRMLVFHADEQGEFYFAEMKNRAIQSFATADIVPFAESMLLRLLDPADVIAGKIRPIAVVHDEIVLEVANTYIAKVRVIFKTIQATIVQAFEEHYALETPLNMPLLIEFGTGKTWAEAKAAGKPL